MLAAASEKPTTVEAAEGTRPPRYLLFLQFILVNVVSTALCAAAWLEGWLSDALSGYSLWLCLLIIAVFIYGLAICGWRLWQAVREIDDLHAGAIRSVSCAAWYMAQVRGAGAENHPHHAGPGGYRHRLYRRTLGC